MGATVVATLLLILMLMLMLILMLMMMVIFGEGITVGSDFIFGGGVALSPQKALWHSTAAFGGVGG